MEQVAISAFNVSSNSKIVKWPNSSIKILDDESHAYGENMTVDPGVADLTKGLQIF
jgi:hypothetical protein